jgi:hypothetical protein
MVAQLVAQLVDRWADCLGCELDRYWVELTALLMVDLKG